MKVVGVTGTIGSGKTLFCRYMADFGAYVVHADQLAKDLMVSDPDLKHTILQAFGPDSYLSDGSLNKSYLAEQAFSKGRANVLNEIVHPAVFKKTQQIIGESRTSNIPLFVYEAALLLQQGRQSYFDHIIWIQTDLQVRLDRVGRRDNLDVNEILRRNERQKQLSEVASMVDEIVINDGSMDDLYTKARAVYQRLIE
jgi:dephospho-CoA kinase